MASVLVMEDDQRIHETLARSLGDAGSAIDRGVSAAQSTGPGFDIAASTARAAGGELRLGRSRSGGTRAELDPPLVREHP